MPGQKYGELQEAIREYGEAAFQNLVKCRALGDAIIARFHEYEGCAPECVRAVPAHGPFDPRKDYGEEAFSFHGRPVIILEPVRFGLCLIVGNREDKGALWLRTVIALEIAGEAFEVFVAARPLIRTPFEFENELTPIFDEIHAEFLQTFTLQVNEFKDTGFAHRIGFLPD